LYPAHIWLRVISDDAVLVQTLESRINLC
jgi:hypothetical protein